MTTEAPKTPAQKKKEIKFALEEQWAQENTEDESEEETVDKEDSENTEEMFRKARERDEYLEHLQRMKAEFENYRKRTQREKSEWTAHALTEFMTELLDVVDNLNRARLVAEEISTLEAYKEGVDMVFDRLMDVLKRRGLEQIPTVGEPFDPYLHEAMLQDPRTDVPPNTIVEEITPGYRLQDRVLRAPRVKVSVTPPEDES